MPGNVQKAQSHDEGKGGKSVTEVHGSVHGSVTEQSVTGAWKYKSVDKSVTGEGGGGTWLHSLLECIACRAWLYGLGMGR